MCPNALMPISTMMTSGMWLSGLSAGYDMYHLDAELLLHRSKSEKNGEIPSQTSHRKEFDWNQTLFNGFQLHVQLEKCLFT